MAHDSDDLDNPALCKRHQYLHCRRTIRFQISLRVRHQALSEPGGLSQSRCRFIAEHTGDWVLLSLGSNRDQNLRDLEAKVHSTAAHSPEGTIQPVLSQQFFPTGASAEELAGEFERAGSM